MPKDLVKFEDNVKQACGKLFDKVYAQFISNFSSRVIFTLEGVFANGVPVFDKEAESDEEYGKRIDLWKQGLIDDVFLYFLPSKIVDFNQQFSAM